MKNVNLLQEKLIRAAKTQSISDRVPYAFEKRILAHIRAQPVLDTIGLWTRALWRAAVPCVAVMLLFSVWPLTTTAPDAATTTVVDTADLGVELETTLMGSVSVDNDLIW